MQIAILCQMNSVNTTVLNLDYYSTCSAHNRSVFSHEALYEQNIATELVTLPCSLRQENIIKLRT